MTGRDETAVSFEVDGLRIEGMLRAPAGAARAAVVLHPHPQFGGDMHNHVVLAVCEALTTCGAATLRFNFRGTGSSEGAHDGGRGETSDALAALAFMRDHSRGLPAVLSGYSFGAQVAASAVGEGRPDRLILISPPLAYAALAPLPEELPVLGVGGDADTLCPAESLETLRAQGADVRVVEGADHGWTSGVPRLVEAIRTFLQPQPRDDRAAGTRRTTSTPD